MIGENEDQQLLPSHINHVAASGRQGNPGKTGMMCEKLVLMINNLST
jgi:hypothetical protein